MIEALGLGERLDEQAIRSHWDGISGPMIARHTEELHLRKGRLTIRVDSAPLRQELGYMRTAMIELINKRMGREVVTELVIR